MKKRFLLPVFVLLMGFAAVSAGQETAVEKKINSRVCSQEAKIG